MNLGVFGESISDGAINTRLYLNKVKTGRDWREGGHGSELEAFRRSASFSLNFSIISKINGKTPRIQTLT